MKYTAPWWVRVEVRVLLALCSLGFWLTIFFSMVVGLGVFVIGRLFYPVPWVMVSIFLLGGGLAGVALFVLVGEVVDARNTKEREDTRGGGDSRSASSILEGSLSLFFWLGLQIIYWKYGQR